MLNKGLDLKLWWTSLQVLEIDATASKYLLLLPPWSLHPSLAEGRKERQAHGCMDRLPSPWQWLQLLLGSGIHWSAKSWGWQGFSYPCCQPHFVVKVKKPDRQTENCGKCGNGQLSFSSCNPRKAKSWSTEITQPMHLQPQRWGNQADKQSVKQLSTNGNDPYKYHVVPDLFPYNMFLKVLSFIVGASSRGAWHHTKLISRVFFNF